MKVLLIVVFVCCFTILCNVSSMFLFNVSYWHVEFVKVHDFFYYFASSSVLTPIVNVARVHLRFIYPSEVLFTLPSFYSPRLINPLVV